MESQLEAERVRQLGARAVDIEGLNAQEILRFIRVNGERTVPRLARDLNMHLPTLSGYVKALKRKRLLALSKNKRGTPLVRLPDPERRKAKVASPDQAAQAAELAGDASAA